MSWGWSISARAVLQFAIGMLLRKCACCGALAFSWRSSGAHVMCAVDTGLAHPRGVAAPIKHCLAILGPGKAESDQTCSGFSATSPCRGAPQACVGHFFGQPFKLRRRRVMAPRELRHAPTFPRRNAMATMPLGCDASVDVSL